MVGIEYAVTTVTEWYENVFLLGVVALFFINSNPISYLVAAVAVLVVFIFYEHCIAKFFIEFFEHLHFNVKAHCHILEEFLIAF